MFCPTCGQPAQGSERFCSNCGTDLTKDQLGVVPSPFTGEPTPMAVPNVSTQTTADYPAAARPAPVTPVVRPADELRGVGGWLLVFCIWITIVSPLWWSIKLLPVLRYAAFNWNLDFSLLVTIFEVITGIQLWRVSGSAMKFVRIYFVLVAAAWLSGVAMFVIYFSRYWGSAGFGFGWVVLSWLRIAAFLAIWVSYFKRSVRVRNTYGENLW